MVDKADSDGTLVTRSDVRVLDDAGRVRELARMLAGLDDSELGRAHAEELLATAAADRVVEPQVPRQRFVDVGVSLRFRRVVGWHPDAHEARAATSYGSPRCRA